MHVVMPTPQKENNIQAQSFYKACNCRTHHRVVATPRLMHCLGSWHDTNDGIFFFFPPLNFYIWVGFLNLSKSFKEEIRLDEKYAILVFVVIWSFINELFIPALLLIVKVVS